MNTVYYGDNLEILLESSSPTYQIGYEAFKKADEKVNPGARQDGLGI